MGEGDMQFNREQWHEQLDQEVAQEHLSITSSPGSIDHILDDLWCNHF